MPNKVVTECIHATILDYTVGGAMVSDCMQFCCLFSDA